MSGLSAAVFDPTNTTQVATLADALSIEFVDEYNTPGSGSVTIALGATGASALVKDRVVRVSYQGAVRYAFVVEKVEATVVEGSNQQTVVASGRGLLSWLEDAVVYPQGGLRETSSDDRPFNYAAEDGPWKTSVTWSAPVGVRWSEDTSPRKGLPTNWPDADAQWIWSTSPTSETVPEGTVNYFRSTFTLTESTRIRFFATADNYFDMYLDGSLVMSSNRFSENAPSFSQQTAFTTRLGAGVHTIAARVRNGQPWQRYGVKIDAASDEIRASGHGLTNGTIVRFPEISRNGTGLSTGTSYYVRQAEENSFKVSTSPPGSGSAVNILEDAEVDIRLFQDRYAGFLMTAYKINSDGRVDRSVRPIRRTNQVAWEVATEEPLFRPAMILRTLIEEAAARSVYRFNKFTYSFNTATPTTGAWSTYVDLFLRVGSDLLSVLDEMVDLGIDFWINPTTCALSAAEERGTDKSATVKLEVANNLLNFSTSQEPIIKTQALIQTTDGWQQVGVQQATLGRRETFVEAGRTRSPQTARVITRQLLAEIGKERITANTVEAIAVTGAVPYVNFDIGDIVTIPSPTGSGTKRARVLSIGMQDQQGTAVFSPELEVLDG
jgi:hypothetical protein